MESYEDLSDVEIVRLYKIDPRPEYVNEILSRYKNFILKTLSRWNASNALRVKLSESDFKDALQTANLAVILFMSRVRDVSKVKNVSVSLKSYIYTELNKSYRHYKYEGTDDYSVNESVQGPVIPLGTDVRRNVSTQDVVVYNKFFNSYDYYKLALMYTRSRKKKAMARRIKIMLRSKIQKLRLRYPSGSK